MNMGADGAPSILRIRDVAGRLRGSFGEAMTMVRRPGKQRETVQDFREGFEDGAGLHIADAKDVLGSLHDKFLGHLGIADATVGNIVEGFVTGGRVVAIYDLVGLEVRSWRAGGGVRSGKRIGAASWRKSVFEFGAVIR